MADSRPIDDGGWWFAESTVRYDSPDGGQKNWALWGYCSKTRKQYTEDINPSAVKRWNTQVKGWREKYSKGAHGYLP